MMRRRDKDCRKKINAFFWQQPLKPSPTPTLTNNLISDQPSIFLQTWQLPYFFCTCKIFLTAPSGQQSISRGMHIFVWSPLISSSTTHNFPKSLPAAETRSWISPPRPSLPHRPLPTQCHRHDWIHLHDCKICHMIDICHLRCWQCLLINNIEILSQL